MNSRHCGITRGGCDKPYCCRDKDKRHLLCIPSLGQVGGWYIIYIHVVFLSIMIRAMKCFVVFCHSFPAAAEFCFCMYFVLLVFGGGANLERQIARGVFFSWKGGVPPSMASIFIVRGVVSCGLPSEYTDAARTARQCTYISYRVFFHTQETECPAAWRVKSLVSYNSSRSTVGNA